MVEALYAASGVLGTLVMTHFWRQMPWNKRYITSKECAACSLHNEVRVVKAILLDLAVANNLPVEKYRGLVQ